jgi:hypothetical protein
MNQNRLHKLLKSGSFLMPVFWTALAGAQSTPVATPSTEKQEQNAPTEQWTAASPQTAGASQQIAAPSPPPSQAAAPVDQAPQPKMQIAVQAPAPAPVIQRTDKTHDGFYTRFAVGFASQSTSLDDGVPAPNLEATGGALVINALVGGAPAPGVIIGGSLALDTLASTTFESGDYAAKTGMNLISIGPFIDGYPNSRGGFHLGGTVGPAFARLNNNTGFAGSKSNGVGLAAWLGYDWWVADQWSVGGLLRFSGANTWSGKSSPDLGTEVRSIALLLTAVYQ